MSILIYKKKTSEPDSAYSLHITLEEGDTAETISGLEPNTGYDFKVFRRLLGYKDSIARYLTATTNSDGSTVNLEPVISLVIDDNSITTAEEATLTASASDTDGTISKVEFYRDAVLLGEVTSAPYEWVLSGLGVGSYSFTAKAFDNLGATKISNAVTLTVAEVPNVAPVASAGADNTITLPANSVTLTGSGTDSDGTIASYLWEQTIGATATITNPNAATTTVTGLAEGTYQFRLTVTDNQGATHQDTVQITVNPEPAGAAFVTPATSDFAYTVYDKDATTHRKRSAFATIEVQTDATQLIVDLYSTMAGAGYSGADSYVSIYDAAKQFVGILSPAATNNLQTLTSEVLPGTGLRNFYLVESGNTQNGPADFVGTYITKIEASNGIVSIVPQPEEPNRVIALGDSIVIGDGSTNNSRYGWAMVLRDLLGDTWGVTTDAWGARYTTGSLGTSQLQQEQADRIVAHMAGATGRKVVLWTLGTNDFGYVVGNPATVAANAAAVWDLVNAIDASIEFILVTPLWRANKDTPNSGGWVLGDYATALINAASTRPSFVQYHNGVTILGDGHFDADNLHPNNAGHSLLASTMQGFISGTLVTLATPALSAVAASGTQINITVGSVANASSYLLEYSLNGTSGWSTLATTSGTYNHTGLAGATQYFYRAKAVGDGVTYFDSAVATANTLTNGQAGTLAAPALEATPTTSTENKVVLSPVASAVSYVLEWSADGATGWVQLATVSGTYNHTGLTPNTPSYYRAKAIGNGTTYLDSAYSYANYIPNVVLYDATKLQNFALSGGVLTKNAGGNAFNSQAVSTKGIGATTNDYKGGVEFVVPAGWNKDIFFGISNNPALASSAPNYQAFNAALYLQAGTSLTIYNFAGTNNVAAPAFAAGDVFRININSTKYHIYRNTDYLGFISHATDVTYPFFFMTNAFQQGAVVPEVKIDAVNLVDMTY